MSYQLYRECVRKKKLKEKWADSIIEKASYQKKELYKYYCNHCQHWHLTKFLKKDRLNAHS